MNLPLRSRPLVKLLEWGRECSSPYCCGHLGGGGST